MAIKILELSTLTELTEDELKSCKGGEDTPPIIGNTVGSITEEAVDATIGNTTAATVPFVNDAGKLTTAPATNVLLETT